MKNIALLELWAEVHVGRYTIERLANILGAHAPNSLGIAGAELEDLEQKLTDQIDS